MESRCHWQSGDTRKIQKGIWTEQFRWHYGDTITAASARLLEKCSQIVLDLANLRQTSNPQRHEDQPAPYPGLVASRLPERQTSDSLIQNNLQWEMKHVVSFPAKSKIKRYLLQECLVFDLAYISTHLVLEGTCVESVVDTKSCPRNSKKFVHYSWSLLACQSLYKEAQGPPTHAHEVTSTSVLEVIFEIIFAITNSGMADVGWMQSYPHIQCDDKLRFFDPKLKNVNIIKIPRTLRFDLMHPAGSNSNQQQRMRTSVSPSIRQIELFPHKFQCQSHYLCKHHGQHVMSVCHTRRGAWDLLSCLPP